MKRYKKLKTMLVDINNEMIEEPNGDWVKWKDIAPLEKDAMRYRWLRKKYGMGLETYLAEGICTENELDEYIDEHR